MTSRSACSLLPGMRVTTGCTRRETSHVSRRSFSIVKVACSWPGANSRSRCLHTTEYRRSCASSHGSSRGGFRSTKCSRTSTRPFIDNAQTRRRSCTTQKTCSTALTTLHPLRRRLLGAGETPPSINRPCNAPRLIESETDDSSSRNRRRSTGRSTRSCNRALAYPMPRSRSSSRPTAPSSRDGSTTALPSGIAHGPSSTSRTNASHVRSRQGAHDPDSPPF